ncbi:MAG: cation:proton antiporter [Candidatus Micrarchaeota archaeon]
MIEALALLAFVLFAGYFSERLFAKWKIPDIFPLLLFGLLLGPIGLASKIPGLEILTPAYLAPVAALVAVLTLVVILFDAGVGLDISEMIKAAPFALTATLINFLATTAACFLALYLSGWNWLHAILVAIIVADTAEEVVFSLISNLKLKPWVKNLLVFEGAFTSTLIGIFSIAVIGITGGNLSFKEIGSAFVGNIAIALLLGAVVSYLWVHALVSNHIRSHRYLLTLGVAFLLYIGVEALAANGVIAVLIFGIAMGMTRDKLEKSIFEFHREVNFTVRSFFFVYLGFIISFDQLTIITILTSLFVVAAMALGRLAGMQYIAREQSPTKAEFVLLAGALPSGLATAVFATIFSAYGIIIPGLSEFIFLIIFESILLSMACTYYYASVNIMPERRPQIIKTN